MLSTAYLFRTRLVTSGQSTWSTFIALSLLLLSPVRSNDFPSPKGCTTGIQHDHDDDVSRVIRWREKEHCWTHEKITKLGGNPLLSTFLSLTGTFLTLKKKKVLSRPVNTKNKMKSFARSRYWKVDLLFLVPHRSTGFFPMNWVVVKWLHTWYRVTSNRFMTVKEFRIRHGLIFSYERLFSDNFQKGDSMKFATGSRLVKLNWWW